MCIRVTLRPCNVKTACKQLRAQSAKCYELHAFARPPCLPMYTRGYRQVMLVQPSCCDRAWNRRAKGTEVRLAGLSRLSPVGQLLDIWIILWTPEAFYIY